MKATAVIGSSFGDEGKGVLTSFFASQSPDAIVCRFNGGAQAGHTVFDQGKRHVFSHFGAGTLSGNPTYLSKFFICNPFLFQKEFQELQSKGVSLPPQYVDPDCLVTTPWDMAINQVLEKRRGSQRHGSCGVGINETVTRSHSDFNFKIKHLLRDPASRLREIKEKWLPERLSKLSIDIADPIIVESLKTTESYLKCIHLYMNVVQPRTLDTFRTNSMIFEGAQGLLLDEDRIDQWPHVTRSKTGLTNVVWLCNQLEIKQLDAVYVSRTYLTRHGAGALPGEVTMNVNDPTNLPNPYQGRLRFAPLDSVELMERVLQDLTVARKQFDGKINANCAFTWADHTPPPRDIWPKYITYGPNTSQVQREKTRVLA